MGRTRDSEAVESLLSRVVEVADAARTGPSARIAGVYAERTLLILALCSLFPSGLKKAPVEGMPEAFETAVYVDTPAGQASWHIHRDDLPAFAHLPEYRGEWDGHSTAEKYRRLTSAAFADTEERRALKFYEDAGGRACDALVHRLAHHPDARDRALAELLAGEVVPEESGRDACGPPAAGPA